MVKIREMTVRKPKKDESIWTGAGFKSATYMDLIVVIPSGEPNIPLDYKTAKEYKIILEGRLKHIKEQLKLLDEFISRM